MKRDITRNENGVVMVATLLILMLLSFVAITMTDTTFFEKKMVRGEAIFKKAFFHAESAAFEGAQRLENVPSTNAAQEILGPVLDTNSEFYNILLVGDDEEPSNLEETLNNFPPGTALPPGTPVISSDYLNRGTPADQTDDLGETSEQDDETYRLIVQQPIPSGSSLALGQSRLYSYNTYGFSESLDGRALIKLGYKKRF